MTKLISGRVAKVPSANVSADRYEFLDISQAEPDLGLPRTSGQILAANIDGVRYWSDPLTSTTAQLANVANTVLSISNFTTANLVEGINLYFTNSRVVSAITPLLTTSNVAEGSNLYFTNSRVLVGVTTGIIQGNVRLTGTLNANALVINGNEIFNSEQGANLTVTNIVTNGITSNTWNRLYTANVVETANNLYFTNARVVSALIAGQNIIIEANGRISANVSSLNLTTDQIPEGTTNKYFTNARTLIGVATGTIPGNLNLTGSITGANSIIVGSGGGGYISGVQALYSNLLYANVLTIGNNVNGYITGVQRLTANIIVANSLVINGNEVFNSEQGSNLFITRLTADTTTSNVWNRLYTANVIETASNLYFTNARVVSALIAGQNITIEANGRISANVSITGLNLTTADVRETSNLYFTNARVVTAVISLLTTSNVAEGSNLYFTNARVVVAVTPLLTTANIIETSGNLYFTNTRVVSALIAGQNIVIEANGRISANSTSVASLNLTTADVRETSNLYFTNARVVVAVTPLLTTANVAETSNLYFTNARVLVGITSGTVVGNITTTGKITADILAANSINVGSGVGGSITDANLISATYIQANTWLGLYTANVVESPSNLFFTNTRSRAAISGSTGVIYDSSTGAISIGQNVATTASVTFKDVFVSNNLIVYGSTTTWGANNLVVSDNMIYLNNQSNNSNPDLGISFNYYDGVYHHAGFFRDASDGVFKVFDNYEPEPDANIFIDTNHNTFRLANLQATNYIGNVTGFVTGQVSSLDNFNTDALKEGSNLYFTNARVVSALIAGQNIIIEANGRISANITTTLANLQSQITNLSTDQIGEGTVNLYYTNSRVASVVTPRLTTANVIETSGNLYFTNSRVVSALTAGDNILIEANGRISANVSLSIANLQSQIGSLTTDNITEGNTNKYFTNVRVLQVVNPLLTTANVIEGSNLYFTNARVVSAVTPLLTTSNVIEGSNLYFTNARVVSAVTPLLTTSNVIEGSNLYFTNARVVSALIAGQNITIEANGRINANATTAAALNLTTADVRETSNLYFTNARVVVGITTGTIVGNITATGTITANILSANTLSIGAGAGGTIAGANLISATYIQGTNWLGLYTSNVVETSNNLYFTNARVVSALIAGQNITIEANGRISSVANSTATVTAVLPYLTTSNVAEGSNLYFTNSRVLTGITTGTVIGNITATGTITANILSANTLSIGAGAGGTLAGLANITATDTVTANTLRANNIILQNINVTSNIITGTVSSGTSTSNTILADSVTSNTWNRLYTANVIETSGNLYFTNARVVVGITTGTIVGNITATGTITANILSANTLSIGAGAGGTLTGIANIVVTNTVTTNIMSANTLSIGAGTGGTIAGANLISTTYIQANNWLGLYTANVVETANNLYFTNARVVTALVAGQNITIEANGRISSVANSTATVTAVLPYLTTSNVAEGSNLYFTNARVITAVTPLLTTANVIEASGNLYFTNARVLVGITTGTIVGNITATGIVTANIVNANVGIFGSGSGGSLIGANILSAATITANLMSSNVLFANAFVLGAGAGGSLTGANNITATGTITANILSANIIILQNINVTSNIITGGVSSGTTTSNVIVADSVTSNTWNRLYTANVIETSGNLYFTNARVLASLVNANLYVQNLIANSTLYANGLVIRNIVVSDSVLTGNVAASGFTGNTITVDSVTSNIWNRLYTSNVIETSGNLYFTNARVVSALSPGQNIILASNGQISANLVSISAGENVTLEANGRLSVTVIPVTSINDSSRFISTGNVSYDLIASISDPRNIMVIVEGLVQMPYVDYNTNGSTLTFSDAPYVGSNVEVRFFGVDTINSSRAIAASVDSFIGDGSNLSYTLSTTPPNKNFVTIVIDGVYQHSDVFTLNNKTITFPEAPPPGSNIDIRVIGGSAGSTYNTRTFSGNGISTTFALTEGFTRDTILVFENGVAQMPLTDYDIVNNNLVFTTAPASNVTVQVRELGISGISGANVVAAIRGADQIVGNLIPTTDINKNLGSANRKFNKLYLEANGLVVGSTTLSTVGSTLSITYGGTTTQVATAASVSAKAFGLSLIFGG